MLIPPPVTGHSAPIFGRTPGSSFQPTVSSVTAPFGVGAGPDLHPGTAFPGDAIGASMVSERPKKVLTGKSSKIFFYSHIIAYLLACWIISGFCPQLASRGNNKE